MSTLPKILLTGVTGNVGGELYKALRNGPRGVRLLVRNPDHAALPSDADVVVGDLDEPTTLREAALGADRVFLLGGGRDMPRVVAELRNAGVEHVVLLTSRSVIGGVPGNAIVDMWSRAEAAVFASGLSWTVLRPSGFMSNALRWREQLRSGDVVRAPFGAVAIAAIDPADIAAVAAVALTDRAYASRCLEISGPSALLPQTQVEILGRALGRDLRFEGVENSEARIELGQSFPPPFVDAMFRFFVSGEFDDARVVPTVNEVLKRAPRTFEQWAKAHTSSF